ncbi:MAG TPA: hypothetical protein ENL34_08090 [Chloroflexi bacterium]|nr:hypothetical protein [Chloroflexota bacterium]
MTTKNPRDLSVALVKREGGKIEPECDSADNTTGCVLGPLAKGKWVLKASADVYWTRGASGITGADVKVDEATPDTDMPLFGTDAGYEIIVEQGDTDNYIAFRTNAGTAICWAIPEGDFAVQ